MTNIQPHFSARAVITIDKKPSSGDFHFCILPYFVERTDRLDRLRGEAIDETIPETAPRRACTMVRAWLLVSDQRSFVVI